MRLRQLAGLWYVLATSYLIARLIANRLLLRVWGVDGELVADALAVSLAQLLAVALLRRLDAVHSRRAGKQELGAPGRSGGGDE